MLDLTYQKRNNLLLFKDLEKQLDIEKCQNYIPIYNKLFQLNNTNYNNVNLDNHNYIYRITNKIDNGLYSFNSVIKDTKSNIETESNVFFKLSPLLDPIKYAVGKYDINDSNLLELPNISKLNSHAKVRDMNNSAYVDGFFSYLSSKLLNKYNFVHGLNFYGSFLGLKNNFIYNATDELDLLLESKFFHEHKNKLFMIDEKYDTSNSDSRCYKSKLNINNSDNNELSEFDVIELNFDNHDNHIKEGKDTDTDLDVDVNSNIHVKENTEFDLLLLDNINELNHENMSKKKSSSLNNSISTCSDCSSRTSHTSSCSDSEFNSNKFTDDENDDDDDDAMCNSEDGSYYTYDSDVTEITMSTEEESINLTITKFPVSIICLEKCEYTLDSYMMDNDISTDEWNSILMQIIMTLITYQKVFQFTHNDLHTNNIMYNSTDIKYLYYKYNNNYYKVPTYGKIYKIIDFGRAIYRYNDFLYCSDSFHKNGDASTQYNFEPYMNDKKPRLEPNYSFDLCRLACSMYDIMCHHDKNDKIKLLIEDWCKDDKGRNVIYKTNGDERYPDFKLYKMIVRTVHNHTPESQLSRKLFSEYLVSKNKIKKSNLNNVMDIDNMSLN